MKNTNRFSCRKFPRRAALFELLESRILLSALNLDSTLESRGFRFSGLLSPMCSIGTISDPPLAAASNVRQVAASVSATPVVSLSAGGSKASEINNGVSKGVGKVTVSRTGSTASALDVHFTLSGSAILDTNYSLTSNGNNLTDTVTIPAGAKSAIIILVPIDDNMGTGPLTATISVATDALYTITSTIAKAHATVTIADSAPVVSVAASRPTASEKSNGSTGQFTISRTGATGQSLAVALDLGGTAVNGTDYYLSGFHGSTLVLPAGVKSASFAIVAINNHKPDVPNLKVVLTLDNDAPYFINPQKSSATVTILDAG